MSAQPHVHNFAPAGRMDTSEVITPQYADELLATNTANRRIQPKTVDEYAAAMKRGEWMFNGDAIRIADDGTILDGQHRLTAVKKSGVSIRALVVRGLPRAAFDTIDRGRKRTNADSLAVAGESNPNVLAATIRWITVIERSGKNTNATVTAVQSMETLRDYPEARRWVSMYAGTKTLRRLFDSYICAVATMFARKYGDDVVSRFMAQLESGEGLKRTDPAYELRTRAMQHKLGTAKIPTAILVQLSIKAFKAFVHGKQVGILRVSSNEEFPTI